MLLHRECRDLIDIAYDIESGIEFTRNIVLSIIKSFREGLIDHKVHNGIDDMIRPSVRIPGIVIPTMTLKCGLVSLHHNIGFSDRTIYIVYEAVTGFLPNRRLLYRASATLQILTSECLIGQLF